MKFEIGSKMKVGNFIHTKDHCPINLDHVVRIYLDWRGDFYFDQMPCICFVIEPGKFDNIREGIDDTYYSDYIEQNLSHNKLEDIEKTSNSKCLIWLFGENMLHENTDENYKKVDDFFNAAKPE